MSIAVICNSKNDDDVREFCSLYKKELTGCKVFATKADGSKIEKVLDKKSIVYVSGLEVKDKGDSTIPAKIGKGEVLAVFFFAPLSSEFPIGVAEIVQACHKKNVYLAFNLETATLVMSRLVAGKETLAPGTNLRQISYSSCSPGHEACYIE